MPRPAQPDPGVLARRRAVGEQVRRTRLHHNLTQQVVCERTGLDVAQLSRIEQGHASPLLDTLIRIADAIGVDLTDLVRQDPAPGL